MKLAARGMKRVGMGFSVKCYLAGFLMFSVKMGKILMLSV